MGRGGKEGGAWRVEEIRGAQRARGGGGGGGDLMLELEPPTQL